MYGPQYNTGEFPGTGLALNSTMAKPDAEVAAGVVYA